MASEQTTPPAEPQWVTSLVKAEPRVPMMGPYMAYLLLLMLTELFPTSLYSVAVVIHVAVAFWVVLLLRHHFPPLGKMHLMPAIVVGVLAALLWVAGQYGLEDVELGGFNLGKPLWGGGEVIDPHETFGSGAAFWGHVVCKIGRAVTIVPIVEELFWRGFILRAFVSWDRFEEVPWGKFTWVAFLGSSLLSTLQHPANWGVSIACWMLYNGLFYWKKSLLCLMITHAVTNLILYIYVVQAGKWQFW
ncbi:MAG: CAAX prenyl protease-related protein [Planctomycetota bacterium]